MAFHEIRFPTNVSFGSRGGPMRKTVVVASGSGREERNSRWADSKRVYNAGYGIKNVNDLYNVIDFFEERRGRLHGFRWKDKTDFKSCPPMNQVSCVDVTLGVGDGSNKIFQLSKTYGSEFLPYTRTITKPVSGTVVVSVDAVEMTEGWGVDVSTGLVTFNEAPTIGASIKAGFHFDVPVRFDTDVLEVDLSNFEAGSVTDIPVVEIRV